MENSRTSDQELLVARSDQGGEEICGRMRRLPAKQKLHRTAGKLMSNSIPEKPWTHISVDFIMKLPLAQGYDLILVIVDRLTKIVHFIPTTEKMLAEGLTRLFRDNVWKLHGLPKNHIR